MPRAKGGFKTKRRRNKILSQARGYYGGRSRLYRTATEAVDKSLLHAFKDRRARKREFRSLWIVRINAAARGLGLTYGRLMAGLKKAGVGLNRKALADMAYNDPAAFKALADTAREHVAS